MKRVLFEKENGKLGVYFRGLVASYYGYVLVHAVCPS